MNLQKSMAADFFPQASSAGSHPLEAGIDSPTKGKRRVLIIDDDANSTHLVKILLERSGPYQVLEENDATRAHQTARRFGPDLILLDVVMPKIDGGELAAQIQADHELHNTPIIFLTALVTTDEAKNGVHIEGHLAVAKPINIPELITAIERHQPVRTES